MGSFEDAVRDGKDGNLDKKDFMTLEKFSFTDPDAASSEFDRLQNLYETVEEIFGKTLELIDIL